MKAFVCLMTVLLVGCTINYTDQREAPPQEERTENRGDLRRNEEPRKTPTEQPVREAPPKQVETPHDRPVRETPPRQVETPQDKPGREQPPKHVETPHDKPVREDPPKHVEAPHDKPGREDPPKHVEGPHDKPLKQSYSAVAYRVAADPDFKWNGFMASIWYPDLDECGNALVSAGAIGDRITAMNLQNAIKAEFKRGSNWPTDDVGEAGMMAMIYYSITEDRPAPPRVTPIVIQSINEKRVKVKVDEKFTQSYASAAGWQSVFAESGVEVEIVSKRTETHAQYPEYRVRNDLRGYHLNMVVEAYYLTGDGRRKQVGAPAMTGMAYFHAALTPDDKKLNDTATELVQKMRADTWRQSSKPSPDENKLKVAYRVAVDSDFKKDGFMASIWYPDYSQLGDELTDLGAISDRIIAMNLQRTAQDQFKSNSHWRADKIEDAGLMAMIYYTVEQNAPVPPRITPVDVNPAEKERVEYKPNRAFEGTGVSSAGWERMFGEAGVKVIAEKKSAPGKREEVVYTCDNMQPKGYHVSIAVEVYYLKSEGKRKKLGKSAQLGMAYWFTEKYPSDGKLSEVTKELIVRMGKEARK